MPPKEGDYIAGKGYYLPDGGYADAPSPVSTSPLAAIAGETYDQYQTRLGKMNAGVGTGFGTPIPYQPVTNPIQVPPTGSTSTPAPTLPQAGGVTANETYLKSATESFDAARKSLEDQYKSNLDRIKTESEAVQKRIDEFTAKQTENLGQVDQLTQPFREDFEKKERERLFVSENFNANQKLVNELDTLLTEGNNLIAQEKGRPIASAILSKRVAKTMSDVSARAGVIQAVLSARNGQIAQAFTMIDRSVRAMNADRQDRLDYYTALNNFYEGQKDEEGKKLITLDKDKDTFLKAQIGLLEGDMARAEENATYIKNLMQDPQTALTVAEAGITLNDTPEEVNRKLAEQEYKNERRDVMNDAAQKGYVYMATDAQAGAHPASEIVTFQDSKGNVMKFWDPPSKTTSGSGGGGNGSTPIPETDQATNNERLAAVGLSLTIATKDGSMTQSALNKVTQNDVPLNIALGIWRNIMQGGTLEEIRRGMVELTDDDGLPVFTQEEAYGYLDRFMEALQS